MKFTANNIIKLFIDAIGQDGFADFYDYNWQARKKEIQKLLKTDYDFDIVNDNNFKRFVDILNDFVDWAKKKDYIKLGKLNKLSKKHIYITNPSRYCKNKGIDKIQYYLF